MLNSIAGIFAFKVGCIFALVVFSLILADFIREIDRRKYDVSVHIGPTLLSAFIVVATIIVGVDTLHEICQLNRFLVRRRLHTGAGTWGRVLSCVGSCDVIILDKQVYLSIPWNRFILCVSFLIMTLTTTLGAHLATLDGAKSSVDGYKVILEFYGLTLVAIIGLLNGYYGIRVKRFLQGLLLVEDHDLRRLADELERVRLRIAAGTYYELPDLPHL